MYMHNLSQQLLIAVGLLHEYLEPGIRQLHILKVAVALPRYTMAYSPCGVGSGAGDQVIERAFSASPSTSVMLVMSISESTILSWRLCAKLTGARTALTEDLKVDPTEDAEEGDNADYNTSILRSK